MRRLSIHALIRISSAHASAYTAPLFARTFDAVALLCEATVFARAALEQRTVRARIAVDPVERNNTKVLEVVVELAAVPQGRTLYVGQRVMGYVAVAQAN